MMARRTHAAERVRVAALDHRVGRRDRGAGRAQCGAPRVAVHQRIGVDLDVAVDGRQPAQIVDVRLRMHAAERDFARERRRFVHDQIVDAARDQLILDRRQPGRAFRMPLPHLVQHAVGVRIEGGCHNVSSAALDAPQVSFNDVHRLPRIRR